MIQVWTKTSVHHLSANSEQEMTDWICALQAVAFRDNVSRQTIEEDNDLYCSSGDGKLDNLSYYHQGVDLYVFTYVSNINIIE